MHKIKTQRGQVDPVTLFLALLLVLSGLFGGACPLLLTQ